MTAHLTTYENIWLPQVKFVILFYMSQKHNDPIFIFNTSDASVVSIGLSTTGLDLVQDTTSVFEDLLENLDLSLKNAGYMYNIDADITLGQITIKPFEDIVPFNQEVFDIIAEELQFTDNLIRSEEE